MTMRGDPPRPSGRPPERHERRKLSKSGASAAARGMRRAWHGFRLSSVLTEMNDMPLDFAQYLSERLGVSEAETNAILGAWLRDYELCSDRTSEPSTGIGLAKAAMPSPE